MYIALITTTWLSNMDELKHAGVSSSGFVTDIGTTLYHVFSKSIS